MNEEKILLDEVERLTITDERQNILHRLRILPKEKVIELKPLPYGVIIQVCSCINEIEEKFPKNNSVKDMSGYVMKNNTQITRMIAFALNCKPDKEPPKRLIRFIKRNIKSDNLVEVVTFIVRQSNLINFMSATMLLTRHLVAK